MWCDKINNHSAIGDVAPMKFIGRIVASLVIGWILGLVLAVVLSGGLNFGQMPAFTIPLSIPIVYIASFLVVRPSWG
jgi:hypothetical protein